VKSEERKMKNEKRRIERGFCENHIPKECLMDIMKYTFSKEG